ncbi:MAG: ATP-binding protein [Pseudomonadota bacterium]|nr:ATP-binding protein [Pseudomonadota bacterium]
MKWRKLLPVLAALLAMAAIGMLGFLASKARSVDNTLHQQRLSNMRVIDALDVGLNRAITQVGVNTMSSISDVRASNTANLDVTLDALEQGDASLRGITPKIDTALSEFLDTIEGKFELAFDFEARSTLVNQRLIAGLDAVPVVTESLLKTLSAADAEALRAPLGQLKNEITTFAVVQAPTNEARIQSLLTQISETLAQQPDPVQEALRSVRSRSNDVIADKKEMVSRVTDFLAKPTAPQLKAVEQAYMEWHGDQVAVANQYQLLLSGYAAILLLILAWLGIRVARLGIRLRRSYRELDAANADLSHANENLEAQVETRTQDLSQAIKDLRSSQAQLVQSEKMASLGQLVAGVAHEINTPLGYARSNAAIVRESLVEIRGLVTAQSQALRLMTSDSATDEEVAESLTNAHRLAESLNADELAGELDGLLGDSDHGLAQIAELVASLKDFSRVDRSREELFNVNDGLDSALKICSSHFKHRVEVVKAYATLPKIQCSPSQLNQVFLNLFTNAAQAIPDVGKIYVHTAMEGDQVSIRILDTGSGMPEDVRARIFEPFYTTKPIGQGTGLGLSIVFRIIEDHGGTITVRSSPGKGTEFRIVLPVRQKATTIDTAAPAPAAAEASA